MADRPQRLNGSRRIDRIRKVERCAMPGRRSGGVKLMVETGGDKLALVTDWFGRG